jgi:lipopolysaccharide export system protein LptA
MVITQSEACAALGQPAKPPILGKAYDDYRTKVNAQPVSGLGDAAYYDGYASISVLKGDAYVRIAVGIANNLSAEKTLAADALPRM